MGWQTNKAASTHTQTDIQYILDTYTVGWLVSLFSHNDKRSRVRRRVACVRQLQLRTTHKGSCVIPQSYSNPNTKQKQRYWNIKVSYLTHAILLLAKIVIISFFVTEIIVFLFYYKSKSCIILMLIITGYNPPEYCYNEPPWYFF